MLATKKQVSEWHQEGLMVASEWRRCEFRMVELLRVMAESKGFLLYECASLYEYVTKMWKIPEGSARDLVTVARKSLEVPQMLEALRLDKATVSKLRKVCPVITPENQEDWLDLVYRSTTREIEKAVAEEKPETEMKASMSYASGTLVDYHARIPIELADKLIYLQDLLSKTEVKGQIDTLEFAVELALEKICPIRKAERAASRREKSSDAEHEIRVTRRAEREEINADLEHAINLRDKVRCTQIDKDGNRCPNRRFLEFHHEVPVSEGGTNDLSNLRTTCWQHHRAHHHEWGKSWALGAKHS